MNSLASMPPPDGADVEAAKDVRLVSLYQKMIQLRDTLISSRPPVLQAAALHTHASTTLAEPPAPPSTEATNGYSLSVEGPTAADSYLGKGLDALVKEQVKAKRRRIEATLGVDDPSGPKIAGRKQKGAMDDACIEHELDVADILMRTHMLVPPLSGISSQLRPASESFDENDYYSSQDNASSPSFKERHDNGDAESDAMAISSTDGEISEDEFEPELEPKAPQREQNTSPGLPQKLSQWQAPAEGPQVILASEGIDDYEPPAADSPQYEPSPVQTVQTSPQQLIEQLAGPASYPPAISVNQIETPAAPQPSHISRLATANYSQQLDQSNDLSSKSEQEAAKVSKRKQRKLKKMKRKSLNGQIEKNQPPNPKKRRRDAEEDGNRKKRQEVGPQSPQMLVKEEPVTPPSISQLTPGRQRTHPLYYGQGQDAQTHATSRAPPAVSIPPGYKLVPVDEDDGYEPEYRPHLPQTMPPPLRQQQHRALLRDVNGNEYFDTPLHQQHIPSSGILPTIRDGAQDWSRTSPQQPRYDLIDAGLPPRTLVSGPSPRRYAEAPLSDRGYRGDEYYMPQPEQFRATSVYEPYSRDAYGRVALPAETQQPAARPYAHRLAEHGVAEAAPILDAYSAQPYRPVTTHQQPLAYGEYGSVRAQSVHPQSYPDPYRYASVAPQSTVGPRISGRAASVYPTRRVSGPLPQYPSLPDNYPLDHNIYAPSGPPPPSY